MALRLDFGRVRSTERTPTGGLRVPSFLTRVGIFTYKRTDGTVSRELRPPEEVFHPESMASIRGGPVTDLHPPKLIDVTDWKLYAKGHVGDDVRQEEGNFLGADLVIQDAETVAKVERGELVEISCGYDSLIDPTPGTWNGEPYDAVQRRIRYNHAALGPEGWGRAGSDVALRLDSAGAVMDPTAGSSGTKPPPGGGRTRAMKFKFPKVQFSARFDSVNIDGVDYTLKGTGAAQARTALEASVSRCLAQPRKDEDAAAISSALEEAMGVLAGAQQQLMAAAIAAANPEPVAPTADGEEEEQITDEEEAEKKVSEEVLDSLVSKRLAVLNRAKQLAPSVKFDGKKEREIMVEAVKTAAPTMAAKFDSKTSVDFIRGVFNALPVSGTRTTLDGVREKIAPVPGGEGGEERIDAEAALLAAKKASREAWKKDLASSRK
jgi:hypothetical protein